jgi:hypothetical protein
MRLTLSGRGRFFRSYLKLASLNLLMGNQGLTQTAA